MTTIDYMGILREESLFVTTPDKALKCTLCLEVMSKPVQCKNGHLFCRSCIEKILIASNSAKECPTCRVKMKLNDLSMNILAAGMIEKLTIRCPSNLLHSTHTGILDTGGRSRNASVQQPAQKKLKVSEPKQFLQVGRPNGERARPSRVLSVCSSEVSS